MLGLVHSAGKPSKECGGGQIVSMHHVVMDITKGYQILLTIVASILMVLNMVEFYELPALCNYPILRAPAAFAARVFVSLEDVVINVWGDAPIMWWQLI